MLDRELLPSLSREVKNLFPLFRYLILQTETHAFCLALACAALLGFYPACLVMIAVIKDFLRWDAAYQVLLQTLRVYYPTSQDFLITNLQVTVAQHRRSIELGSIVWILLGAAGIFIPLEAGFNRLWQVREDRPYWLNQIVGFTLTVACSLLAVFFVALTTGVQYLVDYLPTEIVRRSADYIAIRTTTTCFFIVTIFAFYKFLPNRKIDAVEVLPAAILAGVMADFVRIVYAYVLPSMEVRATQGPFFVSVSFVLLAYFETFVVLGGAFLASHTERYPWMGFLRTKRSVSS
jgi:membrane protein